MKSLFVPIFALLTIVAHADQYAVFPASPSLAPLPPLSFGQAPHQKEITASVPYTVERPTETTNVVPLPLSQLGPTFPRQDFPRVDERPETIRGQVRAMSEIGMILDSPPPVARGSVEEGAINPSLIAPAVPSDTELDGIFGRETQNSAQTNSATPGTKPTDPVGYGALLVVTVITSFGLVLMAFVAYDYRQRWVQSVTVQNDRYIVGAFDMEWEGTYGGAYSSSSVPLYEGYGLAHRSI